MTMVNIFHIVEELSSKCKRMIRRCKLRKTKINDNLIEQKEAYGYTQISSMNNKSYQWDFDCEIGDTKQLHPKIGIISSNGKRFGVNIQKLYARFKIQKKKNNKNFNGFKFNSNGFKFQSISM